MFKNQLVDTSKFEDNRNINLNENMPQHPFRWLFIGSSASGKTNALINILKHLYFDKIVIICPTVNMQGKYLYLVDQLEKRDKAIKKKLHKSLILEPGFSTFERMPDDLLEQLDHEQQNLIVFDDLLCASKRDEKQIQDIFIRGRHKNASMIYLTQSYYKVPRPLRLQANAFNIFHSVNRSELGQLYRDLGISISRNKFINTISDLIKMPYSFIHINIDSKVPYRDDKFEPLMITE